SARAAAVAVSNSQNCLSAAVWIRVASGVSNSSPSRTNPCDQLTASGKDWFFSSQVSSARPPHAVCAGTDDAVDALDAATLDCATLGSARGEPEAPSTTALTIDIQTRIRGAEIRCIQPIRPDRTSAGRDGRQLFF